MSDVKISVIVPVYNSEEYLPDTAASILNQSFEEFELILVDDGSKDRSGKICDELAQKDKRVKVIHKQNGGICSARNCALKLAKGEYIAFCDNDDMYLPGLLKIITSLRRNIMRMLYGIQENIRLFETEKWLRRK